MGFFRAAKAAISPYKDNLDRVFNFFVLTVSISLITHKIFGFRLIPQVKLTFEAFHEFIHDIMHLLVFSWLSYSLESLWYWITLICSIFLPVIPWRPQITIPSVIADIAFVSLAFTRVFRATDLQIPRHLRAIAERQMKEGGWKQIELVEGRFWGPIHRFLHRTNAAIWHLIDATQKLLLRLLHLPRKYRAFLRCALITFVGAVFMWGYIRLAGYLINVSKAGHLDLEIMKIRRRFLKTFGWNLLGAIVATGLFFLYNGWVAEWLEQ